MSVLMELPDEDDEVKATVANRDLNESIQIYQQIYQHITGTTEKIKHKCSDNLLINLDEIKQVHNKINQMYGVHNVITRNETVTVLHSKDQKEQFTSFEKFILSSGTSTSPTISVILKYNLAILPKNANLPNHYQITVRLNSRIAMQKEMEDDAPPFMRGRFVTFMMLDAAEISVEYADYIVARSFIEAFKDWANGCGRVTSKIPVIQKAQLVSHMIPSVMRFIFSMLIVLFTYRSLSGYMGGGASEELIKFLILSFGAFFIIPSIAGRFGMNIERSIDNYVPPSYIILNKGDERLYDEYKEKNTKSVSGTIINLILTVLLGVISCKLDRIL